MQTKVVRGRVLDGTGSPVPRARVYFVSSPRPRADVALLTNDAGAFVLALEPGRYRLGVGAEGFEERALDLEVGPGANAAELALEVELKRAT